jgi:hypothetical protein
VRLNGFAAWEQVSIKRYYEIRFDSDQERGQGSAGSPIIRTPRRKRRRPLRGIGIALRAVAEAPLQLIGISAGRLRQVEGEGVG